MKEKKRRRGSRLLRRIVLIFTLAAAIILADVFSPYIKKWVSVFLPHINYETAAVQLTHEMEKAGELIAVRHTDTGIMSGDLKALFLGTVGNVTAPYLYEIGLGIKLADVKLTPGENELKVTVPAAQMLYDSIQATGEPESRDFWRLTGEQQYQKMQDAQQEACRNKYLSDPAAMQQAWEAVCEQLETLFRQWTGKNLQLRFLREGE
ncbi:MAG: hypothetical protein Q4G00_06525 [Clostridia bacterium]|nr:hypothetical protein [Clostridia bacterium]